MCGFLPFEAKSAPALYKKIVKGSVVIPDFLSRSCRELITSCLSTDPEKRFDIGRVRAHAWLAMDEHGSGVRAEVDALAPVTDAHIAAANAANLVQSGDVPATGRVLSQRREAKAAQQAGATASAAAVVAAIPVAATAEAVAPAVVVAAAASGPADSDDEDEVHRPPVAAASSTTPLASSASSASLSLPPSASSSFSRASMSSAARRPASSSSASASAALVAPASPNALSQPPSPLCERPVADSRLLEFDVDEFDSNAAASSLSSSASHAALAHALPLASGGTSQTVFALGSPSIISPASSSGSHAGPITAFPSGQPRQRSVSLTTTNSGGSVGGIGIGLNLMGLGASVGASVGARVGVSVGVGGGSSSGNSSAAPLVRRPAVATDRYVWMQSVVAGSRGMDCCIGPRSVSGKL